MNNFNPNNFNPNNNNNVNNINTSKFLEVGHSKKQNPWTNIDSASTLQFNTSQTHPLIPNANEYMIEKKYVSIHSEDRNLIKFPAANEFEIQLPQDILNVASVKLSSWSFPSNYNTFAIQNLNTIMTFSFVNIYNPSDHPAPTTLNILIYQYLSSYLNPLGTDAFPVIIEDGFYNPNQMATELTNRFNTVVTLYLSTQLSAYDAANGTTYNDQFLVKVNGVVTKGYQDFVIVYNDVQQKIWFGNRSSTFEISPLAELALKEITKICVPEQTILKDGSVIGLSSYLGLNFCKLTSIATESTAVTRFYYGDVLTFGDLGYWLTSNPLLVGSIPSFIVAPFKLNNMGPAYFYMELDAGSTSLNSMDETSPFNFSNYTKNTNGTNSIVNSAFAKIPITSTPLSQYYDTVIDSYKYFNPPAERIQRIKIKFRYHNGVPVQFDSFPFSFTLEFTLLANQILREKNMQPSFLN